MDFLKELLRRRDYDYFIEKAQELYHQALNERDPNKKAELQERARELLAKAIKIDSSRPEAYLVRAKVILAFVEDNDDLLLARQDLHTAIRKDKSVEEEAAALLEKVNRMLQNSRAL